MKKNIQYGIYVIMIAIFITGCSKEKASYDWLPEAKSENEILLYDRFDQRLFTYDLEKNLVLSKNKEPNYFQLEFEDNPMANIYTVGHSIDNHYKIIEIQDNRIHTLYTMGDLEAIFPLASINDSACFFIKSFYDTNGNELYDQRVICRFDRKGKKLTEYKSTKGQLVSKGVYLNHSLYYTVYNTIEDNYQLFRLDSLKLEGTSEIVIDSLICPELYVYDGEVWGSDAENIEIKNLSFSKKTLNYIYGDYLIQLGPDKAGELILYVTNIISDERNRQINGVVDFKIQKNQLYIYTNDRIEKIDLMMVENIEKESVGNDSD